MKGAIEDGKFNPDLQSTYISQMAIPQKKRGVFKIPYTHNTMQKSPKAAEMLLYKAEIASDDDSYMKKTRWFFWATRSCSTYFKIVA